MKGIHGGDIYRNRVKMDFSVNINPLGMPKDVEEALHTAVSRCHEYPDIIAEELKQAVGSMLNIPKEAIAFGNGASELFMGIVHALKPKKAVIPVPSFYGYEYAAGSADSEIVYYPLKEENGFGLTEDLFKVLTEDVNLLFLANPNNPTGKQADKEFIRSLLKVCNAKGIYMVLDECFIEFCKKEYSMLSEIGRYENLLIVRAFTKIFAIPGVRLGYMVCNNQPLLECICRQLPEWNLSVFAQEAGIACTKQAAFMEETVEYIDRERRFLSDGLDKLGLKVFESETNFILVYSNENLYEKLLQRGILIRDCTNLRGLSKGYYRIAVKQKADNERLLKAIGDCIE